METNYYHGDSTHPFHLSAGAIVMGEDGKFLVHKYKNLSLWGHPPELGECVVLMRESLERGETLEDALHRGLMEEFGVEGVIKTFLGSIIGHFRREGSIVNIEKTTVYYLVTPTQVDFTRRKNDVENTSTLEWCDGYTLIKKMREQSIIYGRDDINESVIIERALQFKIS